MVCTDSMLCVGEVPLNHSLEPLSEKGDRIVSRQNPRKVPERTVTTEYFRKIRNVPAPALSQKNRVAGSSGDEYNHKS